MAARRRTTARTAVAPRASRRARPRAARAVGTLDPRSASRCCCSRSAVTPPRARPRSSPCRRSTSAAARRRSARRSADALAAEVGKSLLRVDGDTLERRIGSIPTVRAFRFDRAFPHTLRIVVKPEVPRPRLCARADQAYLVAASGRVIRPLAPPAPLRPAAAVGDEGRARRGRAGAAAAPAAAAPRGARAAARRLAPVRSPLGARRCARADAGARQRPRATARRHRRPAAEARDRAPDPACRRSPQRRRRATSTSASPSVPCSPSTLKSEVEVEIETGRGSNVLALTAQETPRTLRSKEALDQPQPCTRA